MISILVVDDEVEIRSMLRQNLKHAGYHVKEAANGVEALEIMRASTIDMVITDIYMPEKEGLETIIEIKETWPQVKIIAISGGVSDQTMPYLKVAREFGADHAFDKPFDILAMCEVIKQLMNERI